MPYPKPDDPRYCQGSGHPVGWWGPAHRPVEGSGRSVVACPYCSRAVARRLKTGKLFPHLTKAVRISHDEGKELQMCREAELIAAWLDEVGVNG